jgi:hypothetical protein
MTRRRWKRLKWTGTAICALTLLISWAWAFAPADWHPYPEYFGQRWGFRFWRHDLGVYVARLDVPLWKTLADCPFNTALANRRMLGVPPDADRLYSNDIRILPVTGHDPTGWRGATERDGFMLFQDVVYIPLISIPLLILLLAVPPTALLWYLDRHRRRPGFCRECGYNLTGNVSGRCSECGTPTSAVHADTSSGD